MLLTCIVVDYSNIVVVAVVGFYGFDMHCTKSILLPIQLLHKANYFYFSSFWIVPQFGLLLLVQKELGYLKHSLHHSPDDGVGHFANLGNNKVQ